MEPVNNQIEIRDLRNGEWCWIHRAVIKEYALKIRAIGIMVYNLLASMADHRQSCFPSQRHMAKTLGCSRTTLIKAIKRLEKSGLVRMERKGRNRCSYQLLKVRCLKNEHPWSTFRTPDVQNPDPNDNQLTRINNDIDRLKIKKSNFMTFKGFKPKSKEELLALDLAQGLNDLPGLPLYISLAKKYPEVLLRQKLSEVRGIPAKNIKREGRTCH